MASVIEICNLALSNIRAGSINSLTEASLQAQVCNLKYPSIRDTLLKAAPWAFARRIEPLALLSSVDVFNWAYAYQYPVDCLFINRLILNYDLNTQARSSFYTERYRDLNFPDLDRQVPYTVLNVTGNRVVATNHADLRADYRSRVTDPELFGPTFTKALEWYLAAEIAVPIMGVEQGTAMMKYSLGMYQQYLSSALEQNANDSYSTPRESDFINARM